MTKVADYLNDFAEDIKTCIIMDLNGGEYNDEKRRLIDEYSEKINRQKELEYANKTS